jgi:hypothetical protein
MPTSYVISPDPAIIVVGLACTVVVSPAVAYWPFLMGVPQESRVSPSPLFWPWLRGEKLLPGMVVMVHGIPGTTTIDDEFPENLKPQFRVSSTGPHATDYFVMYHGSPGVKQGDDNWDQTTPSYQPQMRLSTAPHAMDPTLVSGRWRYNEAFLAP